MSTHIVKHNQNIFDIALQLYGSIEGIFDLLLSNPKLSMAAQLKAGDKLEYHDYFTINDGVVQNLPKNGVMNGERKVYHKEPSYPLLIIFKSEGKLPIHASQIKLSGSGVVEIDWGDNSEMETIHLTNQVATVEHFFNTNEPVKRVNVYGSCSFIVLDTSSTNMEMYPTTEIIVDEYVSCQNKQHLKGLLLFNGTYKVDLRKSYVSDLLGIGNMSLQELDLTGAIFSHIDVLDDYLEYIVANYEDRRSCTVRLTSHPSDRGMAAIRTILQEPAWNESGSWVFIINDEIYSN